MKKTTLVIASAFLTCTVFSQTNTATNDQGMQNQTNQSNMNQNNQNNRGNQNNTNNNPQQNPPGQNNNVNQNDWNNQTGQSGQNNQNTQNNQNQTGQSQNQNQSDWNSQGTGGGMPPAVVSTRFTADYPGVQANWSRDHMNNYRAEYKDMGSNSSRSITYDKNGNMVSRDLELGDNDYPTGIKDYFSTNNLKDKHSVWSSEDKDGNKIYYSNYNNDTYWFDKNGKYQKKSGRQTTGTSTTNKNDKNNKTKGNNSKNSNTDNAAPKKDKSTKKDMKKNPQ